MHLTGFRLFPEIFPTLEKYPFNLPIFHHTSSLAFESPVTFFVGENGSGKSTLLEALARKCGIHIWQNEARSRFDFNPMEEDLYRFLRVEWRNGPVPGSFFAGEFFKDFAKLLDEWARTNPGQLKYFGGQTLLTMSHGQSLMTFFKNRYGIKGLYLLDEPETALSPASQVELVRLLKDNSQAGHAQFIIATHSPILLACPGARIYSFTGDELETVDYQDTEHYRLFKDFLNDPESFLGEK